IAREMGWTSRLQKEAAPDAKDEDPNENEQHSIEVPHELPDLQPNPATEGVDWVRDEFGEPTHPLSKRALEASIALSDQYDKLGLDETEDPDLVAFLGEFQTTSAKLAGALDDLAYGDEIHDGAFIVAYLKRALGHLHASQAALEKVAGKKLLPAKVLKA